jgi:putative endonuclease
LPQRYFVYILASRSRTIYIGITSGLKKRVREHREGRVPGFTTKYRVHRLVHFEAFQDVRVAIAREKEIKGWRREKKVALIDSTNPNWDDLAEEWFPRYASLKQVPHP